MAEQARVERNARLRAKLESMLHELLSLRAATEQSRAAVTLDQQSVGRVSRIDAMQAQQLALAADRQRQAQIGRIRRALDRIEEGEFGFCVECGNEIAEGRLEIDPSAHLCIRCASLRSG